MSRRGEIQRRKVANDKAMAMFIQSQQIVAESDDERDAWLSQIKQADELIMEALRLLKDEAKQRHAEIVSTLLL